MKKALSGSVTFILAVILIVVTFVASYVAFKVPYSIEKRSVSCESTSATNDSAYCVNIVTSNYIFEIKKQIVISKEDDSNQKIYINYPEDDSLSEGSQISQNSEAQDKVQWSQGGVKINTPFGYELFISRELF